MGTWVAAIVAVLTVTGCKYGADSFACTDNASCGGAGMCQPNNLCSFPDATCPSGQRYGDIAGTASGQCVGETQMPPDAMPDAPPDARACFGSDPFMICLASAPTTPLTFADSTPIDTTTSNMCVATISGATNYCVIAATTISVDVTLRATGMKPLVLLASDTITVNARIDVGSHRGATPEIGAGANPSACTPGTAPGTGGGGGGGGAGGSFAGLGGNGGLGGNLGAGGVPGGAVTTVTELRGGCPGQDGQGGNDKGIRGNGGGAVFLIAGTKIDVKATINAAGEGALGGVGNVSGGGGGGAGGMIGFDAPTIVGTGLLLATGGGGAEGSDAAQVSMGAPGNDPSTTAAAVGGTGNTLRGGDGGNGSIAKGTPGGVGGIGDSSGGTRGGGGGGGGGAGLIKAPVGATLGTMVSPATTP